MTMVFGMDKFIATMIALLGILQAEVMFAGAFTVSSRTNWPRLGHYVQQQIATLTAPEAAPTAVAAPKRKGSHVNLSTRTSEKAE